MHLQAYPVVYSTLSICKGTMNQWGGRKRKETRVSPCNTVAEEGWEKGLQPWALLSAF